MPAAVLLAAGAVVVVSAGGAETNQPFTGPLAPLAEQAAAQPDLEGTQHLRLDRRPKLVNSFGPRLEIWASGQQQYEIQGRPRGGSTRAGIEFFYDRSAGVSCVGKPPKRPPQCDLPLPPSTELPSDPEKLREQVEAEIGEALSQGRRSLAVSLNPEDGAYGVTKQARLDQLDRRTLQTLVSEETFSRLVALLAEPLAAPGVRAAAFSVLGGTKGVTSVGKRRDRSGRAVSVVRFRPPKASKGARSDFRFFGPRSRYRLVVDPASTAILELRGTPQADQRFREVFSQREAVGSLPAGAGPFIEELAERP